MIVKRNGGMTEFIPSPREKREGLIRDHVLELVSLLHERLSYIERTFGCTSRMATECQQKLRHILEAETENREVNQDLRDSMLE